MEQDHGYRIYMVVERALIATSAPEMADKLRQAWVTDGDGLVMVLESDSRHLGIGRDLTGSAENPPRVPSHELTALPNCALESADPKLATEAYIENLVEKLTGELNAYFKRRATPPPADRSVKVGLLVVRHPRAAGPRRDRPGWTGAALQHGRRPQFPSPEGGPLRTPRCSLRRKCHDTSLRPTGTACLNPRRRTGRCFGKTAENKCTSGHLTLPSTAPTVNARIAGARVAMLDRGIPIAPDFVLTGDPADKKFVRSFAVARQLDAILCTSDHIAAQLLQTLTRLRIRVPDQIRPVVRESCGAHGAK